MFKLLILLTLTITLNSEVISNSSGPGCSSCDMGTCENGYCTCWSGYTGKDCSIKMCQNSCVYVYNFFHFPLLGSRDN